MNCVIKQMVYKDGYQVYFYEKYNGLVRVHRPDGEVVEREEGLPISYDEAEKEAWNIPAKAMEALLIEAKNIKIRTKDDSVMEGELKATKRHLNDMRKLAFKVGG